MQEMSMEQVLSDILKLEAEAKDIVKQQTDRREALPALIEKKLAEMRSDYNVKAEQRIGEIRATELERLESELAEVRADHKRQMRRLSDVAERETENFAGEIFSRVVNATP